MTLTARWYITCTCQLCTRSSPSLLNSPDGWFVICSCVCQCLYVVSSVFHSVAQFQVLLIETLNRDQNAGAYNTVESQLEEFITKAYISISLTQCRDISMLMNVQALPEDVQLQSYTHMMHTHTQTHMHTHGHIHMHMLMNTNTHT